jgi:hypothetical protein
MARWRWRLWLIVRRLAPSTVPRERLDEVRDAVERDGRWERHVEWRISTVTSMRIERTGESGYRRYHVRVECDHVFSAHCPTLRRACEVADLYEQLMPSLWERFGWPSWASRTQLEPEDHTG